MRVVVSFQAVARKFCGEVWRFISTTHQTVSSKGLSGSSVGGEMEASSQRADIEFGSSSFISCSDRSS